MKVLGEVISDGNLFGFVRLERPEILELSEHLSHFYIELIEKLSSNYSVRYGLPQDALRIILRTAIVPVSHCFFERLVRLNKIVHASKCKPTVGAQSLFSIPDTIEEFQERISTPQFNQSVISLLAEVWGLKIIDIHQIAEQNPAQPTTFKNNLFRIDQSKFSLSSILSGVSRYIKWLPPLGRFPALTFANMTGALHKRFFYLMNFKQLDEGWKQEHVKADLFLRESMLNESQLTLNVINNVLSIYDFSEKQKSIITKLFFKFLRASIPLQFLEAFQNNYNAAEKVLAPFKVRALMYSSAGGTRSSFVVGVAKTLGFKIINAQHGGHYGYIEDLSKILEIEWPMSDIFLTWGWTRLPRHAAIMQMQTHPLPSPWLSERKMYWKDLVIEGNKKFDILWMPNMMKPFIGAPSGVGTIRLDVFDEFSTSMIDIVRNAARAKINIYCKPYNPISLDLMAAAYDQMRHIGGEFFVCADRFDKGLTYELLNKCRLVLWDQPGSGFLECIACNIPTMVLWPRIYCEEEDWCIDDFNYLEEVGLIHRTPKSLINETQNFLLDPLAWMNDLQRKLAVQSFANKYALTYDKWWKTWRTYLKQLKNQNE